MREGACDRQAQDSDHAGVPARRSRSFAPALLGAALLALPLVAASEPRPGLTVTTLDRSFDNQAIMIGSDGLPVIAYVGDDQSAGLQPLKVAHCEDIACATATITEVVPDPGNYAREYITGVSLTIGADGFPLIS